MDIPTDWRESTYDVIVIGGGINGACIARDAALRGLSVLLLEAKDWGWGTSAKSSRLAHGGLRYLELLEFGLVHEALQDRQRLFDQAPHLVRPLAFLYPIYPDIAAKRTVRVGLLLYDTLSHGKSVPGRAYLKRDEALARAPMLRQDGLKGAAVYYDGQIDHVERLVLENIADAVTAGAVAVNRTRVTGLDIRKQTIRGVRIATDAGEATIAARTVINAAGPWVDELIGSISTHELIRCTKGVHVAVPKFMDDAMIVRANDGRTFFVLPWHDTCYIGTTDTDFQGEPGNATATTEDVQYLLDSAARYLPEAPLDQPLYTWAGVRALVNQAGLTESNVTRRHILHDHAADGVANLMSLQGGKITTARSLAEAAVDTVCKWLDHPARKVHPTRDRLLPGGSALPWEHFRETAVATACSQGIPPAVAEHLVQTYGARWQQVLAAMPGPEGLRRIAKGSPHVRAEIAWAVHAEQAQTVADVMLRRTTLGFARGGNQDAARAVAGCMAQILGWSGAQKRAQLDAYTVAWRVMAVPPMPAQTATAPRRAGDDAHGDAGGDAVPQQAPSNAVAGTTSPP